MYYQQPEQVQQVQQVQQPQQLPQTISIEPTPPQQTPRTYLLLDGYGAPSHLAEDTLIVGDLLNQLNDVMFGGTGLTFVASAFGGGDPKNVGVNGIIMAAGGHFACHTFSRRGVFFADALSVRGFEPEVVKELIQEILDPEELLHCQPDDTDAASFGQHLILRIPTPSLAVASQLIDEIVFAIGMTKICEHMISGRQRDISVVQPIAESHIAIHSSGRQAILDIFSCRFFFPKTVHDVLRQFKIQPLATVKIKRGLHMDDKML